MPRLPMALFVAVVATLSSGSPRQAVAQGAIACNPMTRGPAYTFEKVLDVADADPVALLPNDRGHALITAIPAGAPGGQCLLRHRGSQTEPIVCTRNIDGTSPFTGLSAPDWNERGTIVLNGTLHFSFPGSGSSNIQVIETDGSIFALPTYDFLAPSFKRSPAITREGDVFYLDQTGSVQRFDPTLPGNDKSETIVLGATIPISGLEPSVAGKLYFTASSMRVGSVQNALGPVLPPHNINAPYYLDFTVADAFFAVPTPTRFGSILYLTEFDIRKRFDVGGVDYVAGNPEFVIERSGAPGSENAPIVTSIGTLAGPCKVALFGFARGVCNGGPNDGLVCDPGEFPDACEDGPGGAIDGYCEPDVQGVFVHQAGTYAAIARPGDPMLGSTVQDFFTSVAPELFQGTNAGHVFFAARLTDGREVVVRSQGAGASGSPVLPTSCAGVSCRFGLQPAGWLGFGPNGVPLYFDPDIATGYDYQVDPDDPLFASVIVPEPLPNGDESFTLHVGVESFLLLAGEQFDLTQVDPFGVSAFTIDDIDPGEQLDPQDPMAFVTGVTFMEERGATVTMTVVPEPGVAGMGIVALATVSALAHGRRRERRGAIPS